MLEISDLNSIDQYLYIFDAIILTIFTLYKAFDIFKFGSSENIWYKSYLNEIYFKSEDKAKENEKVNIKEIGNTYEDIFGDWVFIL